MDLCEGSCYHTKLKSAPRFGLGWQLLLGLQVGNKLIAMSYLTGLSKGREHMCVDYSS